MVIFGHHGVGKTRPFLYHTQKINQNYIVYNYSPSNKKSVKKPELVNYLLCCLIKLSNFPSINLYMLSLCYWKWRK